MTNPAPGSGNAPRIILTTRCNRLCSYCSQGQVRSVFSELTPDEWVVRIMDLRAKGYDHPFLGGGEPLLYEGLSEVVGKLPGRVIVTTNFDIKTSTRLWTPGKVFFIATMHVSPGGVAQYTDWCRRVLEFHRAGINVHPETLGVPQETVEALEAETGLKLYQKDFTDAPHPPDHAVRCHYHVVMIAPDGRRFFCNSKLWRKDEAGVVDDLAPKVFDCRAPTCNGCDWWFIHHDETETLGGDVKA